MDVPGTPDPQPEPNPDAGEGTDPKSLVRRRLLVAGAFSAVSALGVGRLADDAVRVHATNPGPRRQKVETSTPPTIGGAAAHPDVDHVYDLVIIGGRVIDPATGFDQVTNVGIDNRSITGLGDLVKTGKSRVDAKGKVVAPGFIDVLSYEPNTRGSWYKIADGVTTNLGMHGMQQGWWAPDFFTHYEGTTPVNFGGAFSDHWIRFHKLGLDVGATATSYQIGQLADLFESQLHQGWLGAALEPEYTPGVDFAEMVGIAKVAARYGVPCFFHGRYSSYADETRTVPEIVRVGEETGAAVHVAHLPSTGGTWHIKAALDAIDTAVEAGHDVTFGLYPYHYWGTYAASERFSPGWQQRFRIGYPDLQVAGTTRRLTESTFATAQARNSLTIAYAIPESSVQRAIEHPRSLIGSDAIVDTGNNHPRAAGTFCRVLGHWVRDKKALSLHDALAKMTILPARRLERRCPDLARKGRLQRGADADICVFDPDTVSDQATVADPERYSTGIDWVIVGGTVARQPGDFEKRVLAGRPIKSVLD